MMVEKLLWPILMRRLGDPARPPWFQRRVLVHLQSTGPVKIEERFLLAMFLLATTFLGMEIVCGIMGPSSLWKVAMMVPVVLCVMVVMFDLLRLPSLLVQARATQDAAACAVRAQLTAHESLAYAEYVSRMVNGPR